MTRKIRLTYDANGSPVQGSLHPSPTTTTLDIGAASEKNANAFTEIEVVRLIATGNCHVKFGNATVVAIATDMYLASGREEYFTLRGDTFIAVIRDIASTGKLFITPME